MFKGLLDKHFLVGRRLVVNFPNSVPAGIGIYHLPSSRALRFIVEQKEPATTGGQVFYSLVMKTDNDVVEIASFESKVEALNALKKVSNKFRWTIGRVFKWIFLAFIVVLMMDFVLTVSGAFDQPKKGSSVSSQKAAPAIDPVTLEMLKQLSDKKPSPEIPASLTPNESIKQDSQVSETIDLLKGKK